MRPSRHGLGLCSWGTESPALQKPTIPGFQKCMAALDAAGSCRQGTRRCPAVRANRKSTHRPQNLCVKCRATKRVIGKSCLSASQEGWGRHISRPLQPQGELPPGTNWTLGCHLRLAPATTEPPEPSTGLPDTVTEEKGLVSLHLHSVAPVLSSLSQPRSQLRGGGWEGRGREGRRCTHVQREVTPASGKVAAPATATHTLGRRGSGVGAGLNH